MSSAPQPQSPSPMLFFETINAYQRIGVAMALEDPAQVWYLDEGMKVR